MTRSHVSQHPWLYVISAAFVLLALWYSLVTPFFEKSDEIYHLAYIKHLADGQGFPATDPHNPARQEATQPPLYYLIGSLLIRGISTDDVSTLTRLNPYYNPLWDGVYGDNRNRYMHVVEEALPRHGAALALRLLRCFSIVLGCVTVICTYWIADLLFPDKHWLAAGAAACCAFTPRFLYVSGTVNNDVMVAAMCALTGVASLRLVRLERPRMRDVIAVGGTLGAALLSKVSALAILPAVVVVVVYAAYRATGSVDRTFVRFTLQWGGTILLCAAAISGWWYIRNAVLLDGDPTGTTVHVEKWGRRSRALTAEDVRLEIQGLEESYWAVFGLNSIPIDRWVNLILFGIDRLTIAGGIVLASKQWTRRRFDRQTQVGLAALALWALANLASVFYWMYLMKGVNLGRLLYPAMPANALFVILALVQFTPRRAQTVVVGVFSAALASLAIASPAVYIAPNYAPPPILDEADVGPLTERLDANFQGQIVLLGYHVPHEQTWPGDRLEITLYYQALVPFGIDYTVFVHFVDEQGHILVQRDTYPGMGRYPTTLWQPGEIFADTFYLTLPEWTPVPGKGILEVGFYDRDTQLRLLVVGEDGQLLGDSVWFHQLPTVAPPGK